MDAPLSHCTRPTVWVLAALLTLTLASCAATTTDATAPRDPAAAASDDAAQITVPDVTDQDGDDAGTQLTDAGLNVTYDPDRDDATGCEVTDQDPAAGAELDPQTDATNVTLTLDCRQVDWENQEGDGWDTFNAAYSDGWNSGCDSVFTASPDGDTLHYDGEEFSSNDCQNGNPGDASSADLPEDVPDDPEVDGEALGETEGCNYVFTDVAPTGALYYGTEAFTASMCPHGGPAASASKTSAAEPAATPPALDATDYRVTKPVWDGYSADQQRKLAELFVANNPSDCGYADASLLPRFMHAAWGTDYPLTARANKIMLGFCRLAADGE
jgi:hypothetical protein